MHTADDRQQPEAEHRWSTRLRAPEPGTPPVPWRMATSDPTRHALRRGDRWRRSSRGLYVPAQLDASPAQRIVEAAAMLPGYGAIGGWGAAYWRGVRMLDGLSAGGTRAEPVLLCLGPEGKIRPRSGIRISREILPGQELEEVRGLTCTSPLRTAFDGARLARRLDAAVVFLDMMLASGVVAVSELVGYVACRPGWKGVPLARRAVSLANPATKSPGESRLRLLWMFEARLPRPLVNPPVFSRATGQLIGIPDVLDLESATVGEYDGDDHRDLDNHTADNIREERLEEYGFTVVRITRLDLRDPAATARRIRRARARGLRRDRGRDRWTLRPPYS
ncbi:MAG TPA: hypothetical protein VFI30_04775 [Nocardioidaceae bacterium]|nr:hypothetical protein [Nocardioidaceae bacterium]